MTHDELLEKIANGAVVECYTVDEKRDTIRVLYEMGFPCSRAAEETLDYNSYVDMGYPYVGLNRSGRIDGYPKRPISREVIEVGEAFAPDGVVFELGDVASLLV